MSDNRSAQQIADETEGLDINTSGGTLEIIFDPNNAKAVAMYNLLRERATKVTERTISKDQHPECAEKGIVVDDNNGHFSGMNECEQELAKFL